MPRPAKAPCCCPPDKLWINAGCKTHGVKAYPEIDNRRSSDTRGHRVKALPSLDQLDMWMWKAKEHGW